MHNHRCFDSEILLIIIKINKAPEKLLHHDMLPLSPHSSHMANRDKSSSTGLAEDSFADQPYSLGAY